MAGKSSGFTVGAVVAASIAAMTYFYAYQCGDVKQIRGQTVIITGASSGIGEELAIQYGSHGAKVVIAARRASELQRVAAKVLAAGATDVSFVPTDMSSPLDCEKLIEVAVSKYGRIHTLVLNHAAFDDGLFQSWNTSTDIDATMVHQFKTNVAGAAYTIRAALPHLIRTRGHVGVTSSASVKVSAPFHPGYVTSKTALHGLIDVLRTEFHLTNTPVTLGIMVVGMVATPEVIKDEALKGLAMPVPACASEMLCALQARWDETYVPKWYYGWTMVTWAGGRKFSEWTMNNAYVLKVPRYVESIRLYKALVRAMAGEKS